MFHYLLYLQKDSRRRVFFYASSSLYTVKETMSNYELHNDLVEFLKDIPITFRRVTEE
ncbi:MAG: hypothetical protein QG641_1055 [Candidatus Poribacteria bacterium]|nr:hypothetical protein [Candidatus Poribacteria bacterium]